MEMSEVGPGFLDDPGDRSGFRAHRFDIQNDLEIGRREALDKLDCVLSGIDEISLGGRERFEADFYAPLAGARDRLSKSLNRPLAGLFRPHTFDNISLS